MDKVELVRKAFGNPADPKQMSQYLTDDYQFVDSIGSPPMSQEAWEGMGAMLRASVPDIQYIIDDVHQDGEDVLITGHFTGTFKQDLNLSAMNMGVIPATGKPLNIPGGTSRISFTGDKISKNHNLDTGPNAGLPGFLAAFRAS